MRPQVKSWVRNFPWRRDRLPTPVFLGFPDGSDGKESACNAGYLGSVPGLGRSTGGGHGNPLQYSCLETPQDRGGWWTVVSEWLSVWVHTTQLCSKFWNQKICLLVCSFSRLFWLLRVPWDSIWILGWVFCFSTKCWMFTFRKNSAVAGGEWIGKGQTEGRGWVSALLQSHVRSGSD